MKKGQFDAPSPLHSFVIRTQTSELEGSPRLDSSPRAEKASRDAGRREEICRSNSSAVPDSRIAVAKGNRFLPVGRPPRTRCGRSLVTHSDVLLQRERGARNRARSASRVVQGERHPRSRTSKTGLPLVPASIIHPFAFKLTLRWKLRAD